MAEKLTEQALINVIICDPLTTKGEISLGELGLQNVIDEDYFFKNLRIEDRYSPENSSINYALDAEQIYEESYPYDTLDTAQIEEKRNEIDAFSLRFESKGKDSSPILLVGVAGNGKTIDTHRHIRELTDERSERFIFSFDDSPRSTLYGVEFNGSNDSKLSWVACRKLLEKIMELIVENQSLWTSVSEAFLNKIVEPISPQEEIKAFFRFIGKSSPDYSTKSINQKDITKKNIFYKLLEIIDLRPDTKFDVNGISPTQCLNRLIRVLCYLLYCKNPSGRYFIVFDNIEEFIVVDERKIQIPDYQLKEFFDSVRDSINTVVNELKLLKKGDYLGWDIFKFILVIRRTSQKQFFYSQSLQNFNHTNSSDITGIYMLYDIWGEKKKHVLKELLKDKYPFNDDPNVNIDSLDNVIKHNTQLIKIVDQMMFDNERKVGSHYQKLISPLMSYGLRRNARAQAHAAFQVLSIFSKGDNKHIHYNDLFSLINSSQNANGYKAARYLYRRALMEFQFKSQIADGDLDRWAQLGIGNINVSKMRPNRKEYNLSFYDNNQVSVFRRILSFLYNNKGSKKEKTGPQAFPSISLRKLAAGVLCKPDADISSISDDDFLAFSRVLIALGNMKYAETRSAPYIILWVEDNEFHLGDFPDERLSFLLKKILSEKENDTELQKKYCVRLTDAGCSFLVYWHASFSFLAALYCFTLKPLFFLKDIEEIEYVIKTVYEQTDLLCKMYENEASSFCGNYSPRGYGYCYLPIENGICYTYREKVKKLHMRHLDLYEEFIVHSNRILNFSPTEQGDILKYIAHYRERYRNWDTGSNKCF